MITEDGLLDDNVNQSLKNECWKEARGKADIVIVCDFDEFLYPMDKLDPICLPKHIEGWQMVSAIFPKSISDIRYGFRDTWYDKTLAFNPNLIEEINYTGGAHSCSPVGFCPRRPGYEQLVLHCKLIGGVTLALERNAALAERISKSNEANGWSHHWKEQEWIYEHFARERTRVY